jgi:hypothetical protein
LVAVGANAIMSTKARDLWVEMHLSRRYGAICPSTVNRFGLLYNEYRVELPLWEEDTVSLPTWEKCLERDRRCGQPLGYNAMR